jgi:aminopeptidase 2
MTMFHGRLPNALRPLHYDLVVRTNLDPENLSFDGVISIELDVLKTTSIVVMNAAPSLTIGPASVISTATEHGPEQHDVYRSYDTSLERVTLHFARALDSGSKIILRMRFNGKLAPAMDGYYYSTCILEGKAVHYSTTSFAVRPKIFWLISTFKVIAQPISARKTFPCWDEPALKSTYTISLISRQHLVNVSNMPIAWEGPLDAILAHDLHISYHNSDTPWKITRFERTAPVSNFSQKVGRDDALTSNLYRCHHTLLLGRLGLSNIWKAPTRVLSVGTPGHCGYMVRPLP